MPDIDRLKSALADRYTIEREIGGGGMATVYLATDVKHDREVAIKVLRPELSAALGTERFLREIKIAANLTHPHVLTLIDSGEAAGMLFYVMPYIEGSSLRERLSREGELPVGDTVRILREVVDALAYAHGKGIVHRDIKPDNILITDRHAIVMDFGVAKAVTDAVEGEGITTTGLAIGTPSYMAPEQAAADDLIDHRADIYAIGAMAYELLTGSPPFTGTTAQAILAAQVTEEPRPITERRGSVPSALDQFVLKCLEKHSADRWQSAEEMLPLLDSLATPSGGVTPTGTLPVTAATRPSRSRKLAIPVIGAVALAAAIIGVLVRGGTDELVLDPDVLAVAPFDVVGTGLESWGEGLSDMLSHLMDGAGPLRTVPPTVVLSKWEGRADPAAAQALGVNVGAGFAVFGRLITSGADSVRLAATLYDVQSENTISDIEVRSHRDNVDRLADSLAVRLLRELSRIRAMGAARLSSIGSSPPAAIRAFLQGEQRYRRLMLDSAAFYYERAIEFDSGFALAMNRMGSVTWWNRIQTSRGTTDWFLLAGARTRRLSVRESLLVAADSIWAGATVTEAPDSSWWAMVDRLHNTLQLTDQRYPNDPQIQYRIGEARLHFTKPGWEREFVDQPFARAVELDSTFAPAYEHLIEYYIDIGDLAAGRRATDAFASLSPGPTWEIESRLTAAALDAEASGFQDLDVLLETASGGVILSSMRNIWLLRDSVGTLHTWFHGIES